MPKKKRIRPVALCVFRRGNFIFAARGYDRVKQQTFYRPIGGGIEFGESAIDTVRREVLEELNAEVTDLRYIGTLENIFVYEDKPGHEIIMLFDGRFVEEFRNQDDYVAEGTDDGDILFTAEWRSLDYFREGNALLHPDALLDLLDRDQKQLQLMDTLGPGNFQRDDALDTLADHIDNMVVEIRRIFQYDSEETLYDDEGEGHLIANIDIILTLCEHYNTYPSAIRELSEVSRWKKEYLDTFDRTLDQYNSDPEYYQPRREIIAQTFDRLYALVAKYRS